MTHLASIPMDAATFSAWDKVGAVGVAVFMVVMLWLRDRSQGKRFERLAEQHFGQQAEMIAATTATGAKHDALTKAVEGMEESNNALHRRIDDTLMCSLPGCPVRRRRTRPSPPAPEPPTAPNAPA